jgi:hypothetical protein
MGVGGGAFSLRGTRKARAAIIQGVWLMIAIDQIKNFYPASMSGNAGFLKHILKELFHRDNSQRILHFRDFIRSL